MASPSIQIPCQTCGGSGKSKLPEELRTVFALFTSRKRLTSADLCTALQDREQVKQTAMNNRLERLRGLGLLSRTRKGRFWIYERTKQPTEAV